MDVPIAGRDPANNDTGNGAVSLRAKLWSRLIAAWLLAVLVAFFIIRILGSSTAHRFLIAMRPHHG